MKEEMLNNLLNQINTNQYPNGKLALYGMGVDDDEDDHVLTNDDGILIAEAIRNNPTIYSVSFASHYLGHKAVKALVDIPTIVELNITDNNLGMTNENIDDYNALIESIKNNTTLKTLVMNRTYLHTDSVVDILQNNHTIETLHLYDNGLNDPVIFALAANTTVTEVNLAYNNITDAEIQHLLHNTTLKILNISGNSVSNIGAQILAKTHLVSLYGTPMNITYEGLQSFLYGGIEHVQINNPGVLSWQQIAQFNIDFEAMKLGEAHQEEYLE